MDRSVSTTVQRSRLLRQIAFWLAGATLLTVALLAFRSSLQTTLNRSQIRTAVAEEGAVDNTLTASGLVLPEFEEIITSPVSADIQEVLVSEGAEVKTGQFLLRLNPEALQLQIDKDADELALQRNSIQKLRLELARSLYDLQIRDSIKGLTISRLEADLDNIRRLVRVGGATQEQLEQAELDLRIARLEKRQLENEVQTKQQSIQTDLRESEIKAQIQQRSLDENKRRLGQASLSARRAGVITWINQKVGSSVREGEQLVKIADLDSYRVEGTVADLYADRIRTGMPVQMRINDSLLIGRVTNIRPTVENDILTFDVALDNPRHPLLRPNLRVEVYVVTDRHEKTVRVANGPAFTGQANQPLFVVENERAIRRQVPIGLSNFDYVELRDKIRPGDVVIISDMSDYDHLKEIKLK